MYLALVVAWAALMAAAGLAYLGLRGSRWRWVPLAVGVAAVASAVGYALSSEATLIGAGKGVVPAVTEVEGCQALRQLQARELRWRWEGQAQVHSDASNCGDASPITGQQPEAGTRLKPGGVVTLQSPCGREFGCAEA